MIKINYKSDFKINESSETVAMEVPFVFSYYVFDSKKYVVSFDGHNYVNCERKEDGSLDVIFNQPDFGIGHLKVERKYAVDDTAFADGVFDVVTVDKTDVFITSGKTFETYVETLVVPPYLKGDKGDPMTWSTMTETEREELVHDVAEAIDPEMVMTENEKSRQEAEQSRQTAEQQRSATFNTLKGEMQSAITAGNVAAGNAQKVVDEYDTKVAEQDSKLTELGSKVVNYLTPTNNEGFYTTSNGKQYTIPTFIREVYIDRTNYNGVLPSNLHLRQAFIRDENIEIAVIDDSLTWPDRWGKEIIYNIEDTVLFRCKNNNFNGLFVYILINVSILEKIQESFNEYFSTKNIFIYENCNIDNCPVIKEILDVNYIIQSIDLGNRYPSDVLETCDSYGFNEVKIDNQGVIIEYINKDFEKGYNIPVKFNKEIDFPNKLVEDVAKDIFIIEDNRYKKVLVDSEGRIIQGVLNDGSTFIYNIESYNAEKTQNIKSEYVEDVMNTHTNITIPTFLSDTEVRYVSNEDELKSAVSYYSSGNNVLIVLKNDISIYSNIVIEGDERYDLVIQGNGNKIYGLGEEFLTMGCIGGRAFSSCIPTSSYNFLNKVGKSFRLSETKYYNAGSRVLDIDGNTFGDGSDVTDAGIYKIKIPDELSGMSIKEDDHVYINLSCWFVAYTFKVLYTDSEYIYFESEGTHYSIDYDYYYAKIYPSFNLINYSHDSESVSFKENKIYFPWDEAIYSPINNIFNMISGKVKICNITFGITKDNCIQSKGILILENCSFENFSKTPIYANDGRLFINKCKFRDCLEGCIESTGEITETYICNSSFINVGLRRSNYSTILAYGHYYISNNYIEDYGYGGIRVGLINMTEYTECYGIIEGNILKQSIKYSDEAKFRTIMDAGAIYIATNNNPYCICRNNKIINFNGRHDNRGIFCDDGAYNIYIFDNVIENVRNSHAISARYATGRNTAGIKDNVNKIILHNYLDNGISIGGNPDVEDNGCKLGVNFITKIANIDNSIKNINYIESQKYPDDMFISEGIVKSKIRVV